MKLLNTLKFGVKSYFKNGPIGSLKKIKFGNVSKFGNSSSNIYYEDECEDLEYGLLGIFMLTIIIITVAFAFLAVQHISPGESGTSRNIRLGMYALLVLSGGSVAWMYILMWALKIKV